MDGASGEMKPTLQDPLDVQAKDKDVPDER